MRPALVELWMNLWKHSCQLEIFHSHRVTVEDQTLLTPLCLAANRESEKKWCRSGDWRSCKSTGSVGSYEDSWVAIRDDRTGAFTVTLKKLRVIDTAWYWCSAGQQNQMVHVLVAPRPTTSRLTNKPLMHSSRKQSCIESRSAVMGKLNQSSSFKSLKFYILVNKVTQQIPPCH